MENRKREPFQLSLSLCANCGRPRVRIQGRGGALDGVDKSACLAPEQMIDLAAMSVHFVVKMGRERDLALRIAELKEP